MGSLLLFKGSWQTLSQKIEATCLDLFALPRCQPWQIARERHMRSSYIVIPHHRVIDCRKRELWDKTQFFRNIHSNVDAFKIVGIELGRRVGTFAFEYFGFIALVAGIHFHPRLVQRPCHSFCLQIAHTDQIDFYIAGAGAGCEFQLLELRQQGFGNKQGTKVNFSTLQEIKLHSSHETNHLRLQL